MIAVVIIVSLAVNGKTEKEEVNTTVSYSSSVIKFTNAAETTQSISKWQNSSELATQQSSQSVNSERSERSESQSKSESKSEDSEHEQSQEPNENSINNSLIIHHKAITTITDHSNLKHQNLNRQRFKSLKQLKKLRSQLQNLL